MNTTPNKRIALYGGSFNPPGRHHRALVEELLNHFDEVVVLPCGPRPDKPTVQRTDPLHRAAMVDLAFRGLPRVRVEHFDLEQSTFTRNHELEEIYGHEGELWHVVGADIVQGGATGNSEIHRSWHQGERLWTDLNFAVFERPGYELVAADLPIRSARFAATVSGSSTEIRDRVWRDQSVDGLVAPEVADYIQRYRLYQGGPTAAHSSFKLVEPRPLVVFDEWNPEAAAIARTYPHIQNPADANSIIVIGGDGTMMRALREHWPKRLPFYGVNAGNRGYLMNDRTEASQPDFLQRPVKVRLLPLLYVEATGVNGERLSGHAVNDAWVERASGQAAWIEVKIDGRVRLPQLIADGALLATAHGSNAYARAMGARPLSVDARELLLVGSNVSEPVDWKSAPLALESRVEFRTIDPDKRPLRGFIDGVDIGPVLDFRVRISQVAAVQLALTEKHDLAVKLHGHFFPWQEASQ
jgi:NAD+ kinase